MRNGSTQANYGLPETNSRDVRQIDTLPHNDPWYLDVPPVTVYLPITSLRPAMPDNDGLTVTFTEILYGVVTANALYKMDFAVSIRNAILAFALLIILEDWIDYTISTDMAAASPQQHLVAYVLDVTILIVWYQLTIVPVSPLRWFLGLVAVVFFLQGVWDLALLDYDLREVMIRRPYWQLSAAFVLVSVVHHVRSLRPWTAIVLSFVLFIGWKGAFWVRWFRTEEGESSLRGV